MVKIHASLTSLIAVCLLSGLVLTSNFAFAENTVIDDVIITVPASCTLTTNSGDGETYSVSMQNGQYKNDIGQTTLTTFCNTNNSFAIYAIGYSNDTYGNTEMITTTQGATNIATGTATSGATSNWAMKLESVTASGADVYTPTIENGFSSFSSVPSSYIQVAKVNSVTGGTGEMSVKATYAIFVSPTQTAGSYTGKVRYTAIQPASEVPSQPRACTKIKSVTGLMLVG